MLTYTVSINLEISKREALVMDNGRLLKGHFEGKARIIAL